MGYDIVCAWKKGGFMATVKSYNKRTGITYVYSSKNYYDKEDHKYKSIRKLIGKLDENGNVVPTNPRNRKPKDPSEEPDYKALYRKSEKECQAKTTRIKELEAMLEERTASLKKCERTLKRMLAVGNEYSTSENTD